jgi:hypothetical protein
MNSSAMSDEIPKICKSSGLGTAYEISAASCREFVHSGVAIARIVGINPLRSS